MFNDRENIRPVNYDSFMIILVVFLGFLLQSSSFRSEPDDFNCKHVPALLSAGDICAVSNPEIHLPVMPKSLMSVRENYYPAVTGRNPVADNKTTDIKIFLLQVRRHNIPGVPQYLIRYHLFPSEKDEPYHLS
jgi:hypothetical protein